MNAINNNAVDFSGTKFGHSLREKKQDRNIALLCLMGCIVYIGIGGIVYPQLPLTQLPLKEDVSYIDGMYFAVVTFTTVGYGDITMSSDSSKIFTIFFVLTGVFITLSILLNIVADHLFGLMKNTLKSPVIKTKLEREIIERISNRSIKVEGDNNNTNKEEEKEEDDDEENSIFYDVCRGLCMSSTWFLVIFLPAILIGVIEGWNALDIIYFAVVTATTVGYGDKAPQKQWTRLISIFYLPICILVMTKMIGTVADIYLKHKARASERKFIQSRRLSVVDIYRIDRHHGDGDGVVTYDEFLIFMLISMGKVQNEDMKLYKKLYDELDRDNDGKLTKNDLFDLAYGGQKKNESSSELTPAQKKDELSYELLPTRKTINLENYETNSKEEDFFFIKASRTSSNTTTSNNNVDEEIGGAAAGEDNITTKKDNKAQRDSADLYTHFL